MEEKNSIVGGIVITAIIVGFIAYSVGYSAHPGSSNGYDAAYDSYDNTYSEDQYQEVVTCLEDANSRLDDINNEAGSVGDGDSYEDLVDTLSDIENNAEISCQNYF